MKERRATQEKSRLEDEVKLLQEQLDQISDELLTARRQTVSNLESTGMRSAPSRALR